MAAAGFGLTAVLLLSLLLATTSALPLDGDASEDTLVLSAPQAAASIPASSMLNTPSQPSHAKAQGQASVLGGQRAARHSDDSTPAAASASSPSSSTLSCSGVPYDFSGSNYCDAGFFTGASYPTPPAGMTLRSVQLMTRHGDRTPVSILPSYDVAYDLCGQTATQGFFDDELAQLQQHSRRSNKREAAGEAGQQRRSSHRHAASSPRPSSHNNNGRSTRGARRAVGTNPPEGRRLEQIPYLIAPGLTNPFGSQLWEGNCMTGQLTSVGVAQLDAVGRGIREIYVDQLGFLPPVYSRANTSFYLRTTDIWRTKQSAESLLTGLWPTQSEESDIIPFHSFPLELETMYPNALACDELAKMTLAAYDSDAWAQHLNAPSVWAELYEVLNVKGLDGWGDAYDHFVDNFRTRQCNSLPLPCNAAGQCISNATAEFVYAGGDWEYRYLMNESPLATRMAQVGISAFMAVIRDVIVATVTGDAAASTIGQPEFAYYSGHDTTIAAVLGFMNITGMTWPPYASNMIFELWQADAAGASATDDDAADSAFDASSPLLSSAAPSSSYSVRILYNGGVLRLFAAGCCDDLCPYDSFLAYFNSMIPDDLVSVCQGDGVRAKIKKA